MQGLTLREATDADWPIIRHWLQLPEIQSWWGPASATEAEVIKALGSEAALTRIIEFENRPVGYAHACDALMWGDELPDDLVAGTWDLDIFIAERAGRGKGVGSAALAMLKDEVFSTTLATAVAVFPSVENERAVRAYELAGFRWKRIWHDPVSGPSWFMVAERPPT